MQLALWTACETHWGIAPKDLMKPTCLDTIRILERIL
jgi:hypothetical protein